MYRPAHFDVPDPMGLLAELSAVVPATLVTASGAGLSASILPMLFVPDAGPCGTLLGHLARGNPQWRDISTEAEALAIFDGPDAYISPSLYETKRLTGRVVPTWDYTTVHAHGNLVVHDDVAWLAEVVRRLTDRHEAGRPSPWSVDDPPAGYVEGQLRAIVGLELRITRVVGKRKLSQNRSDADVQGVIDGLSAGSAGDRAVASDMRAAARRR
ncbi:MAG: FMN-binding negative transcriptional regulator [Candidatus Limnocylindrales bacterium]